MLCATAHVLQAQIVLKEYKIWLFPKEVQHSNLIQEKIFLNNKGPCNLVKLKEGNESPLGVRSVDIQKSHWPYLPKEKKIEN